MAYFLPVKRGLATHGIPVNANNRTDIYTAAGVATEIVNSPDTTPSLGGKFPALTTAGVTYLIGYQSALTGVIIEEFSGLTPGAAVQGGWTS